MKYCKETTARLIRAAAEGLDQDRNWKAIVNRFKKDMSGSCTEGLVSHILSNRFSRAPQGWSDEGLGRPSNIRVYLINGDRTHRAYRGPVRRYAARRGPAESEA